ncbi:DUF3320 domain-containing protein [Asticcacaulis sp.]|uniref:DUF3320 domain-containing protein n=1 Tax=Asticcacaulis sp. TaxID=1872648 RepID=UPI002614701C|nr:DUF3320 domain-containing protein [Asticcacaulis sp.]
MSTTYETPEVQTVDSRWITHDFAPSLTYASFQNAIPALRSIAIVNQREIDLSDLELELVSQPGFIRSKSWRIDHLGVGQTLPLSDRRLTLDANYLAGLNEAERGTIHLVLRTDTEVLETQELPIRLLARDEWGGSSDMAQLLPAFVMPNDPGVTRVLKAAADQLANNGHPSGLDGYQSGSPERAFLLTASIYTAVCDLGLHYAEPPASFESVGQKIRRPSVQIAHGLATCLDTTVLLAAAMEGAGLHPVILLFSGHAAVGVWLTKRTLSNTIEFDDMDIRKAIASKELLVFETTGVTHRPAMGLAQATESLARRMADVDTSGFVAALDIRRARSGGITPLASHEALEVKELTNEIVSSTTFPQVPLAGDLPKEWEDIKPTTANGRIDRWQKKLLDLTLRNRLLNFPDSRKTIPFLCTDVSFLEDRLAAGHSIHLISLPQQNPMGERDETLYREVRGRDIHREFATQALERDELPSPLDAKGLEARLIELHRQARSDLAESGTNTLFLAVGFLRWKKSATDARTYRAPLLLVPVKLERKSASSRFTLAYHEDEPRFNATLLQFLERDFDLKLPQFAGELPQDESGIDVPRILGLMRQAIRDVPGMEVIDETALSTFSFAKYLMWKDLTDRTDALRGNRVVRHLIDTPDQPFDTGGTFREERELDHCAPADIIALLPADSSQIAASLAAADGRDFVIVGPPGTGKSQTIANMIANCLAGGKTVLFVAEKTAALDVVYRRLREHGLGDHCLELHSNKADRRRFLTQLRVSWESQRQGLGNWVEINDKLRVRRDQLNAYVKALHQPAGNGLTAFQAMGIALKNSTRHAPKLQWGGKDSHNKAEREGLAEIAAELGRVWQAMERRPGLQHLNAVEWSSSWQDTLIDQVQALRETADTLHCLTEPFTAALGLAMGNATLQDLERLGHLANLLVEHAGTDLSVMFDVEFSALRPALSKLDSDLREFLATEAELSVAYPRDGLAQIPVTSLDASWRQAVSAIWPLSVFKQGAVRKQLQMYASGGVPRPGDDLPRLGRLQVRLDAILANALAERNVPYAGLDTNVTELDRRLSVAEQMRDAIRRLNRPLDEGKAIIAHLQPLLSHADRDASLFERANAFARAHARFTEALRQFNRQAERDLVFADKASEVVQPALTGIVEAMDGLLSARHLIRDWTAWCALRNRAEVRGLSPLIHDLEAGMIAPADTEAAFHLAYARWWLPLALDADPILREFRRFQHEHAIEDFRHLDDLVRKAATARVIAAVSHDLPEVQSVPRKSELGLLRHQMELQKPSRTIREMIGALPTAFSKLAPCMLMSPLSIAQYLPPDKALFDVVIFDEASQITTWDAVGAIARGRQTIIVGDPKQLPPTNFFGRNEDEGDDETPDHEVDMESILDEAKASGIPMRDLRWHYRSRNESLIAFSNHHYYQNRLITFPSPDVEDRAVQLRTVKNGVYDKGKSRTNPIEARAVADEAVRRMTEWLALPETARPTLGIITFNSQQQGLIMDLLDEARRRQPALEWFFAEDRTEATIVKNLENVQGDERDVILFSITFWKDAAGKTYMDFGALNRDGGERRLNVAVTRARQELIVFSGFTADQVDTSRTKAVGVHHLKAFLDFAERGAAALPSQALDSVGGIESPFEAAVIEALEARGWQTIPQVGVSGFRIDIGIRHPDRPGAYLAGVECDGATYHRAATARDRDKVREQVLTGLGWVILRVWSTDWWFDAKGAAERLHDALSAALEDSRTRTPSDAVSKTERWDMGHDVEGQASIVTDPAPELVLNPTEGMPIIESDEVISPALSAGTTAADLGGNVSNGVEVAVLYQISDLSDLGPDPDRFHDFDYRHTLKAMIDRIIALEAPVRADILAQRIARAHGWLRTGPKIRERIDLYMRDVERVTESSGEFIWRKGTVHDVITYRAAVNPELRRPPADIALPELASIVLDNPDLFLTRDPALELARLLGVERLTASSRARLDEALAHARTIGGNS